MATVLLEYRTRVRAADARIYYARAKTQEAREGATRWFGWIAFLSADGGA
jgi:hypothetical protein